MADKLLSKITKAIEDTTVVESFDWEDARKNEKFSLDLTPMVDDVMEGILKIKRGKSRSQIRQQIFDRGWKRFAKSKDEVRATIRETIERLCDERVTLTLSLLDRAISLYEDLIERQQRYSQETPEQRQTEKAWLEEQRQKLEEVQFNIAAVGRLSAPKEEC